MRGGFIGPAPGLSGRLSDDLQAEDSLPAGLTNRELFDRLEREMAGETTAELWSVAYVLYRTRRAGPLALVAAEICRRESGA